MSLKQRLVDYLEKHNLISDRQFGFRKHFSTEHAVITLIENIIHGISNNKKCLAVFLDLTKAFDTVNHNILLGVMYDVGFRGVVFELFSNYLSCRMQKVKIDGILSTGMAIKTGVPQGTILGPVLFLLYINSLIDSQCINGLAVSYADDTVILFQADSWNEVYQTAENELKTVQKWINSMRLSINTTKTKFLTFSLNKQDQPARSSLTIHNETCLSTRNCKCDARVEKVTSTKYLGLVLDENLKWKLHIEHIVKRLSGMMYKFYELRNILAYNNLKIVYYALAESFIRYCILIWGGLYQDPLKQLNVIQNSILKILFKKERRYSTQSLYTELKITNIKQLH